MIIHKCYYYPLTLNVFSIVEGVGNFTNGIPGTMVAGSFMPVQPVHNSDLFSDCCCCCEASCIISSLVGCSMPISLMQSCDFLSNCAILCLVTTADSAPIFLSMVLMDSSSSCVDCCCCDGGCVISPILCNEATLVLVNYSLHLILSVSI